MDLSVFFQAVDESLDTFILSLQPDKLGRHIQLFRKQFPDWEAAEIVLIGSEEYRGSSFAMHGAADLIRKQLYAMSLPVEEARVVDLGNLKPRETPEAYYEMLAYVIHTLIRSNKRVIILGGSQDITYGQYMAYEELNREIEYVHIDSRFDLCWTQILSSTMNPITIGFFCMSPISCSISPTWVTRAILSLSAQRETLERNAFLCHQVRSFTPANQ